MTKRYAYIRTPEGLPYAGQDGKHAPTHILAEIGRSSVATEGNSIGWSNFSMLTMEPVLRSAFVLVDADDQEIEENDAYGILWESMSEVAQRAPGSPILVRDLLQSADRKVAEYLRQAEERYVLVSSLSVTTLPMEPIDIGGCTIEHTAEAGSPYPAPEALLNRLRETPLGMHVQNTMYRRILVRTRGRSPRAAAVTALKALNLLRGLWSLIATYGSWSLNLLGTTHDPLGVVHLGPVQTLYTADGKSADNAFWYDPDFRADRPIFDAGKDADRIEQLLSYAIKQLQSLNYRHDLETLFRRYAEALDQPNPDVAFLQMWSLLEKITDTVGAQYDKTIDRAVWPYPSYRRPLLKEVLNALRNQRNQYVHSARSSEKGEQLAYLIKDIIDPHLRGLLRNKFEVGSLKEYAEFLSLPVDESTLTKRREMLDKAIRLLPKPKSEE